MKIRNCARILVINPAREVLLLRYEDKRPIDPEKPDLVAYWTPPGGGVNDGESFEAAAVRELEEETGIEPTVIGPCVWIRERQLRPTDTLVTYCERYFVSWCTSTGPLRNRTAEAILEIKWWSLEAIRNSGDTFLPGGFPMLIEPILRNEIPPSPVYLGT